MSGGLQWPGRLPLRRDRAGVLGGAGRRVSPADSRQLVRHDWLRPRLPQTLQALPQLQQEDRGLQWDRWETVWADWGDQCDAAGDLERLRRFWLTGTCNPKKEEKRSSEPLAPEQFLSAFFILMMGALLAAGLCSLEHVYFKYLRQSITKTEQAGCCALLSLVMKNEEFLREKNTFNIY